MLWSSFFLVAGLFLLVGGGDLLVRGVSAAAAALGVPPLVIGLTVVAFGTSTPELVVNVTSAVKGETDLAFGNIIGSCSVNLGFVLALTALVRPLAVERSVLTREIPLMLLAVAAIVVMSEDSRLGGGAIDALNRSDGLVLLLLFGVFLYYNMVLQSLSHRATDPFIAEVREAVAPPKKRSVWIDILIMLAGIVGVGAGGRLTVMGAVGIAEAFNVPGNIIGLTIVSFGTTLPELTTCILSARRGKSDIAIGNIVGSNIFNLLCVGGIVATVRPLPIPQGGQGDLVMMAALSALLLPLAIRQRTITRAEGALLLALYLGYMGWRTTSAAM